MPINVVQGHTGPFKLYPNCNFIITVGDVVVPTRKKIAGRHHGILGDDGLLDGMIGDLTARHHALLLFNDWRNFNRWLHALTDACR
jgi:hypothetical protein